MLDRSWIVKLNLDYVFAGTILAGFLLACASMKGIRHAASATRSAPRRRPAQTKSALESEYISLFGSDLPESLRSVEALAPERQDLVILRQFVTYSAYEDPI